MEEKSQLATSLAGDTVSASNGEWTFSYEPTEPKAGFNDNGGIDIFITAKVKPASSAIEFTYASGTVIPYHEPPLSVQYKDGWSDEFQADIKVTETQVVRVKDGVVLVARPEYVVNSIAFYADNKSGDMTASGGKNYRTGKVGHLYRMKAVDNAGKSAWFDWSMPSPTQIRLTDTTGILQTGAYPITIQPVPQEGVTPVHSTGLLGAGCPFRPPRMALRQACRFTPMGMPMCNWPSAQVLCMGLTPFLGIPGTFMRGEPGLPNGPVGILFLRFLCIPVPHTTCFTIRGTPAPYTSILRVAATTRL
jgi:hypothetical protein